VRGKQALTEQHVWQLQLSGRWDRMERFPTALWPTQSCH